MRTTGSVPLSPQVPLPAPAFHSDLNSSAWSGSQVLSLRACVFTGSACAAALSYRTGFSGRTIRSPHLQVRRVGVLGLEDPRDSACVYKRYHVGGWASYRRANMGFAFVGHRAISDRRLNNIDARFLNHRHRTPNIKLLPLGGLN